MLRPFRWVFRLAIFLAVLALIAVGADYGARLATQAQIASAVKHSSGASSVSVKITSFPYLYHLVANGSADKIDVVAHNVPAGALNLSQVDVTLRGVVVNRSDLMQGKEQLERISSASVSVVYQMGPAEAALLNGAEITAADLHLAAIRLIPDCSFQEKQSGSTYTFTCSVAPVPQAVLDSLSR